MNYHIHTLGCKFNQYESAKIDEELAKQGHSRVDMKSADVVIINSCAVTSEATRKSFQIARHVSKINPKAKLIFTGCAVHSERVPKFDLVLGNGEKLKIGDFFEKNGTFVDFFYYTKDDLSYSINGIPGKTRSFLSIENGCNWACAYCAIPHFRGTRIRSKPFELAVEEARKMIEIGTKEIVITGINVALYEYKDKNLEDLINGLTELRGDFRIRLGSIDPRSLLNIVNVFKRPKMCHHVHLSVQSGSDSVLKRMRRPYTTEDVKKVVKELRKIDEFFSFSVDVIVGFPGEGEKEFNETYDLLEQMEVSRIHVFPFSPRKGTLAFSMDGKIEKSVKKFRVKMLRELGKKMEKRFREKTKNVEKNVLVERVKNGVGEGLDEYYLRHFFEYDGKKGEFVKLIERVVDCEGLP